MTDNRGKHPNSLANLQLGGGKSTFAEPKKVHQVTVTSEGWQGLRQLAKATGHKSISELLEKLGREGVKAIATDTNV